MCKILLSFLLLPFFLSAKIYDCFTFNHELDLLELRLRELNDYVDYFVLVECNETQRGTPKPFHYEMNKKRFDKFKHKIIHVMVTERLATNDLWARENYQRDQIIRGLKRCSAGDIIIISDVDEIIRGKDLPAIISHLAIPNRKAPKNKTKAQKYPYVACQLDLFVYYMNGFVGQWNGPVITTFPNVRKSGANSVRSLRNSSFTVKNAGWHFSSVGGVEMVLDKIACNVHGGYEASRESVKATIEATPCIPIDSLFPQYVLDHLSWYIQRGFIKENCTITRETIGMHIHW